MHETRALAGFVARHGLRTCHRAWLPTVRLWSWIPLAPGLWGPCSPGRGGSRGGRRGLGGPREASVFTSPGRPTSRAALANGVMIGSFECEPLTGSHASGTVLPAALAGLPAAAL